LLKFEIKIVVLKKTFKLGIAVHVWRAHLDNHISHFRNYCVDYDDLMQNFSIYEFSHAEMCQFFKNKIKIELMAKQQV
jgi:hypothetical protein